MKEINLDKYKNYKPSKFSYFKENMKLVLQEYPQAYENIGMIRSLISKTSFDPEQFAEVIAKSKELPQPYSRFGYVINQLKKNKKKPEVVDTLFGQMFQK